MNHLCYKTIFSKRLGALVAVGEHACSQTKGQGASTGGGSRPEWGGARFVGRLALGFAWVGLVWSQTLPQGAQVVQGTVGVSQSGQHMAITQSSAKAVVNWQSFDIGQNAKVTVVQPSSQSVLLNRVLSDNPTQILGQLQANGQVVLVNPKGIVVGSDGSVSASAFTASTLNISDADFMAGTARFVRDGATGAVVNKGLISVAPGGYVALLGAKVQNEGRIVAPQGAVLMGAGDAAVLPEALTGSLHLPVGRTGKIKLELSPATVDAWVKNDRSGVIVTEGGQVYMRAAAVHGAVASVFQSGSIDTSAAQAGDVHVLADGGRIVVDGQITANSSDKQRNGGDIVIGRDMDTGVLAASTDVSAARLESQRGFVETSGDHLVVDGVQVKAGQWLLDPTDITITAATAGMASSGTNPVTQTPNTSGTTASTVSATTLASSLSAGTSVVVKTTNASGTGNGDITVASNIAVTGSSDATLTLQAERDIVVNTGVSIGRTGTNKLNVVLNSDTDGNGTGAIVMNSGSAISSNGGNITLGGGTAGDGSGFARGYSTRVQGVQISGTTLSAAGGNLAVKGQGFAGSGKGDGVSMVDSVVNTSGTGTLSLTGVGAGTDTGTAGVDMMGATTITGGSTGAVTVTGSNVSLGGGGNQFGVRLKTGDTTKLVTLTSEGGNVTVTGTGGGSGALNLNHGVRIEEGVIRAGGMGTVNVTGTGGTTTGTGNHGVVMSGTLSTHGITSSGGAITVTGIAGGSSGGSTGINIYGSSNAQMASGSNAEVSLVADSVVLDGGAVSAGSGTVNIKNRTAGTLINVGGTSTDTLSGTLKLDVSSAELARISAGTTVIGRNDATGSGLLTVDTLNMGAMGNTSGNLTLVSGANIAVNGAVTKSAGADANLTLDANNAVDLNAAITGSVNKLNVQVTARGDATTASSSRGITLNKIINANGGTVNLSGTSKNTLGVGGAWSTSLVQHSGVVFNAGSGINASQYTVSGAHAVVNSLGISGVHMGSNPITLTSTTGSSTLRGESTSNNLFGQGLSISDNVNLTIQSGAGTASLSGNAVRMGTAGGQPVIKTDGDVTLGRLTDPLFVRGSNIQAQTGSLKILGNVVELYNSAANVTGAVGTTISLEANGNLDVSSVSPGGGTLTSANGTINLKSHTGFVSVNRNVSAGDSGVLNISGKSVNLQSSVAYASSGGTVTITADNATIGTAHTVVSPGTVTIKNLSSGTQVNIGGNDVATSTLGISQAELNNITAANLVLGSATAGNVQVSSAVTTKASTGNLSVLTGGNMTVNAVLNVGDDPATTGTVEASKTLTLNASGASSTVTDVTSGAIKADKLELLGTTAAYTLDSTSNAVNYLAGNTGSVNFVNGVALRVATVNTVGLTTTGDITLRGTSTLSGVHALLVSNAIQATGSGNISLNGEASSGHGMNLAANVTANTGTISLTGTSAGIGMYVGNSQISSKGAIALSGTSTNNQIGLNLDGGGASVVSVAGGPDFAGADAITITGSGGGNGLLLRRPVTNNSTNGATTIQSLAGNISMDQSGGVITNASTAGAINLFAGNGTSTSSAGISAAGFSSGPGPQIIQNANADVVLSTDGNGHLTAPKIVKNSTGAGDIVLAAGKLLAAGVANGGQVKPVSGNTVTNSGTGSLYVYSGSPTSANTASFSLLDSSLADLYLTPIDTQVQNTDANVAYATSGVRNTIAGGPKAQVLFREKVNVGNINGATVAKTYGDANTGNTQSANLWADMTTALQTANSTAGVSQVNTVTTTSGTLKITDAAIIDSLLAPTLQTASYSTAQKLKAKPAGYTYAAPSSSKYTTGFASAATVTVAAKSATVSGTATNVTYNGLTQAQTAATSSGFISGDNITISGESSGKNAGTYTSNMAVSGTDAGNYSVTVTNADLTIAKANLALSGTRVYDAGKTFAGQHLTATGVNGETFTLTGSGDASNLASKNVQTNQALSTVTGLALGSSSNGGLSSNYNAISTTGSSVSVTAKSATVSGTATNVTYNGLTQAQTAATSSGFISGDTITISGEASGKNAGTYTSNMAVSGTDASNYSVTVTNADLTIAKANLSVAMSAQTKTYDGTTSATLASGAITATGVTVNGVTETASVSQTVGTYNSKNVASASSVSATLAGSDFTGASGVDLGNYNLPTTVSGTGSITAKSIRATAQANDKVYDASSTATLSALGSSGVVSGDTVTFSNTGASFADRHVAKDGSGNVVGKTVTVAGIAIDGTDASNYALASTSATTTAKITPKALTLAAVTGSKTYDGTTVSTGTVTASALESVDTVTATQSFASKNVLGANGSTLQVNSGFTVNDGNSGNNYTVTTTTATGTITKANLTVTANADARFVTQADATGYNGASYKGLVNGEASTVLGGTLSISRNNASTNVAAGTYAGTLVASGLAVSGSGSFDTKNAGTGKTVTVSDVTALTKADGNGAWSNYNLTTTGSKTTTANIAKKDVTLDSLSASNKTYDGNTDATITAGAISGSPLRSDRRRLDPASRAG